MIGGSGIGLANQGYGAINKNQNSFGSSGPISGGGNVGLFLSNDINDPSVLRKKISDLEQENRQLKE